jgi:hypothetical protein
MKIIVYEDYRVGCGEFRLSTSRRFNIFDEIGSGYVLNLTGLSVFKYDFSKHKTKVNYIG